MVGCIAKKIGMTRIFDESGTVASVTILEINENRVVGIRNKGKNGYDAVQIGYGVNRKNKNKSLNKVFGEKRVPYLVKEFRLSNNEKKTLNIGDKIGVDIFKNLEYIDAQAKSIGRGFQGVFKRYGMRGGPKTHGSHFHRTPGSVGNCSTPARIFKGKKMPGHMGFEKVAIQNLKLMKIDEKNNLILLKGSVPGKKGNLVVLKKAIKKQIKTVK